LPFKKKNNNVRSIDVGTQNLATLRAGESNQNIHRTDWRRRLKKDY
jgi:hypothetical protein